MTQHFQYSTTTTTTTTTTTSEAENQMATMSQRATPQTSNGSLLPFRRNTQPSEPAAYRTTLLNPKPLTIISKEATSRADRARRASTPNPAAAEPKGKEKELQRSKASVDSSSNGPDTDPDYNPSTSVTSYESNNLHIPPQPSTYSHSRPSTAGTSGATSSHAPSSRLKRTRGSILVAASDALGNFKLGRRRTKTAPPPLRQPYIPAVILPDVIEISAPRRDEEVAEREKLKEAAARAILGPAFLDTSSNNNHLYENDPFSDGDDEFRNSHDDTSAPDVEVQSISNTDHSNVINASSMSVAKLRHPSRSMHSRNNSITFIPLPPFPSTPSALAQCTQNSATLPKYYPSTSLRIFALSKSWKSRYMVLSSPINFPSTPGLTGKSPSRSYLHLFKSAGGDEKELERLEINEESVVFVAEEEVAGRRHVVKVGGIDVGALKRELNYEEDGKTMWFLQITDPVEAQKWIASIKNAVLSQRTVRAGLSATHTPANEPRGDLDVIMKIRHASLNTDTFRPSIASDKIHTPLTSPTFTSPTPYSPANSPTPITPPATSATFVTSTDPDSPRKGHYDDSLRRTHTAKHSNPNYAPSVSSQSVRSQATTPKSGHISISGSAVTALKGLFTRPRSASRASYATSFDQERDVGSVDTSARIVLGGANHEDRESAEGSFASMGNSLLGMLRSPDGRPLRMPSSSGTGTPQKHHTMLPFSGGPMLSNSAAFSANGGSYNPASQLERKIVTHPELQSVAQDQPNHGATKDRTAKSLSLGALSLQPPPRKRWTASGGLSPTEPKNEQVGMYHHVNGNSSVATSFGLNAFSQHDRSTTQPFESSPNASGHTLGTPERPRAPSLQSVSTFASTGDVVLERSSTSTKRSNSMKRWSRQGSNMLSVPSPPSMPHAPSHGSASSSSPSFTTNGGRVHPYAVGGSNMDRPPSRTSTRSVASDQSVVSGLPTFSKRASTSSAVSVNINGGPQSHAYSSGFTNTISRLTNPHRTSMPPPRPAPTSALPPAPAPDQETPPKPSSPQKTSFRDTVAQRALRLSRMAPAPPPPTALPPRPDEIPPPSTRDHRRTSSMGSGRNSSELYSIPSSPLSLPFAPPYPPPSGPLPPTPGGSTSPPSRHTSFKQRLRILSAPSQSNPTANNCSTPSLVPSPLPPVAAPQISNSQPATPIAEKIIDTSFMNLYTPITPSLANPMVRTTSPPPDQLSEVTSLSPPPRRSSKQMSLFDKEIDGAIASVDEEGTQVDVKPLSMSRHGSVISLGIVSM